VIVRSPAGSRVGVETEIAIYTEVSAEENVHAGRHETWTRSDPPCAEGRIERLGMARYVVGA
jgi:hypothetical protein